MPRRPQWREAISERAKAALAAAKARGTRLGTPDAAGAVERMRVARKAQAAQFSANVLPIIREVQAAGYTSPQCNRWAAENGQGWAVNILRCGKLDRASGDLGGRA